MSEQATEELAPLAPTEEQGGEETVAQTDEAAEESPAAEPEKAPEWSKPLQKAQMENANLRKDVAELKQLILKQTEKPQTQAQQDRLAKMLEKAKLEYGESSPALMEIVNALAEEIRDGNTTRADLQRRLEEVDGTSKFEQFVAGRPAAFRAEFVEAQAELIAQAKEEFGEEPSTRELRLAMTQWTKNWDKAHAGDKKPARAISGNGRTPVVPSGSGPRSSTQRTVSQILDAGEVPDGRGGTRQGNLLGY